MRRALAAGWLPRFVLSLHTHTGLLDADTMREIGGATTVADAIDARTSRSWDILAAAADSPLDVRACAHAQMRLPKAIGGLGLKSAAALARFTYAASRLATASRLAAWFPIFASRDAATDTHPWFAAPRVDYEAARTLGVRYMVWNLVVSTVV